MTDLIKVSELSHKDKLHEYSDPEKAQKNAFLYLGSDAILYKSSNPRKKYMIYDPKKGAYVHFGSMKPPYEDYTKHEDEDRRLRYLSRALNMKGKWQNNMYSPNNLSIFVLWM